MYYLVDTNQRSIRCLAHKLTNMWFVVIKRRKYEMKNMGKINTKENKHLKKNIKWYVLPGMDTNERSVRCLAHNLIICSVVTKKHEIKT